MKRLGELKNMFERRCNSFLHSPFYDIRILRISIATSSFFLLTLLLLSSCATAPASHATSGGAYAWPPPPAVAKIKWLSQWANRYDFGKPGQVMEFLVGKERVERLVRPNGVVADSAGNIYVADSEMRMIFLFDMQKKSLKFLGMGSLKAPVALAIDNKDGILFVSDVGASRVFGLNKDSGDIVVTVGTPGEFVNPAGLVYDENRDRLYVSDSHEHVVKVFDKSGRLISTIGKRGSGDGEFNYPSYMALDNAGNLYVVDSFNFRVQIFNSDGKFLKKFGKLGDASGSFSRPSGIGVDSDGHIYVVDASFNNFQIFDQNGRLLLWVGNAGKKPGEFYLPSALYIDSHDRIYVTDTFNRRIQVFQYFKEKRAT
jgi:sugar lactone lactonase YvrE